LKALCSASKRIAKKEKHKLINYLQYFYSRPTTSPKYLFVCLFVLGGRLDNAFNNGVEGFNKDKLNHAQTIERNI
jgi:hypothetical protein